MSEAAHDPYAVLGVSADVSDAELRRVYRELVKRHHPDHNGGSPEAAARFARIQDAYAAVTLARRGSHARGTPAGSAAPAAEPVDPDIEARIAKLEHELAARRQADRRRAQAGAQEQRRSHEQAPDDRARPTPEELGIYSTDDSFTKIIDDAAGELGERLRSSEATKQFAKRLSEFLGRRD